MFRLIIGTAAVVIAFRLSSSLRIDTDIFHIRTFFLRGFPSFLLSLSLSLLSFIEPRNNTVLARSPRSDRFLPVRSTGFCR